MSGTLAETTDRATTGPASAGWEMVVLDPSRDLWGLWSTIRRTAVAGALTALQARIDVAPKVNTHLRRAVALAVASPAVPGSAEQAAGAVGCHPDTLQRAWSRLGPRSITFHALCTWVLLLRVLLVRNDRQGWRFTARAMSKFRARLYRFAH